MFPSDKRKELFSDKCYFVMKSESFKITKEVKRSDGWWRLACGDDLYFLLMCPNTPSGVGHAQRHL